MTSQGNIDEDLHNSEAYPELERMCVVRMLGPTAAGSVHDPTNGRSPRDVSRASREIARRHMGQISFEAAEGHTTLTIDLSAFPECEDINAA
ncbi:MAG: hypothetical protein ACOC9Y_02235 [Chloroflexota bacterium]